MCCELLSVLAGGKCLSKRWLLLFKEIISEPNLSLSIWVRAWITLGWHSVSRTLEALVTYCLAVEHDPHRLQGPWLSSRTLPGRAAGKGCQVWGCLRLCRDPLRQPQGTWGCLVTEAQRRQLGLFRSPLSTSPCSRKIQVSEKENLGKGL